MKISLVVCTYMRPNSLKSLLKTVQIQTKIPKEILIIDGSTNLNTESMIEEKNFKTILPLTYYKVPDSQRGLTKQRNYGVAKVSKDIDIISFLDDDIELNKDYFEEIDKVFKEKEDTIGVGGITINENNWEKIDIKSKSFNYFYYDGWRKKEDVRNRIRNFLSLIKDIQPATKSGFSHETSIGSLPPNGKIYKVDFMMGGIANYKRNIFNEISFSPFFEGYGLYEDKDFSLKAGKYGNLYINTNAKVEHHHDPLGRPNYIKYGQMVVWNGWRVWRVSNPNPKKIDIFKWWSTTLLLTYIQLGNAIFSSNRKKSFYDFIGRNISIIKLIFIKPSLN